MPMQVLSLSQLLSINIRSENIKVMISFIYFVAFYQSAGLYTFSSEIHNSVNNKINVSPLFQVGV